MYTTPVSSYGAANSTAGSGAKTKGSNSLGDFNNFMKILASELQNQDPTDPVKNTEYVAQLAQMESLSQLQNMNNVITTNSSYNLIGKSVTYQMQDDTGATTTATGTAKAVVVKNNEPYLVVNGGLVKVSDVIMVAPVATTDTK